MRTRSLGLVPILVAAMLLATGLAAVPAKDSPRKPDEKSADVPAKKTGKKVAKEPETPAPPAPLPVLKGRLPAHFGKVVTRQQRLEIYRIQSEYDPQIRELRDQLDALLDQRDAEIDAVLTPEQRKQIAEIKAAAKERRRKAKEDKNRTPDPPREKK